MARKCTVCSSKDRNKIDLALVNPNETLRTISYHFGISKSALKRHKESGHIAKKIAASTAAKEERQCRSFLEDVNDLKDKAEILHDVASGEGDVRGACAALREMRGAIELKGKATGELKERHEVTGKDGKPVKIVSTLDISAEVKKLVGILPAVKL
jgi:hypothetical protein